MLVCRVLNEVRITSLDPKIDFLKLNHDFHLKMKSDLAFVRARCINFGSGHINQLA